MFGNWNKPRWRPWWGRHRTFAPTITTAPTGMRKYYIRGKGEVRLSDADFKGQGGQAAIYAQGSTAYKIYSDRLSTITEAKIRELSVLDSPSIIRPLDALVDDNGNLAGYSMRYIDR